MVKGSSLGIGILIFVVVIIFYINTQENPHTYSLTDSPISIASYNLQVFGISKASNPTLMQQYVPLIQKYDIFLTEEIKDDSGVAFKELCDNTGYSCQLSSRAGSTSSKEQYGIMWNNRTSLLSMEDFNLENISGFERPPVKLLFQINRLNITGNITSINSYNVTIYLIHTKPDNAQQEIDLLEQMASADDSKYIAVMGDLNMDCDYYKGNNFVSWYQLIPQGTDTTTGSTTCTYDRIIVNPQLNLLVAYSGVDGTTTKEMSDHRPVYFYLN